MCLHPYFRHFNYYYLSYSHLEKIRSIDVAFAEFIYQLEHDLEPEQKYCVALIAAYVSAQSGQQHSCIHLTELGQPFEGLYVLPHTETLLIYLKKSKTVMNVTVNDGISINLADSTNKPLVLDSTSLYLHRYWCYEYQLSAIIQQKSGKSRDVDLLLMQSLLFTLFDSHVLKSGASEIERAEQGDVKALDWQKIAVCIAVSQNISFITGGPGTGKTTTVTKLLALLQGLAAKRGEVLNIQLVAPTGKAAARLTESIAGAKRKLATEFQQNLPEQCQTIHRLLGAKPNSVYFKADTHHKLHLDVLVLDEASMVDLPLMTKLFAALPDHAQVVLLGDQNQLSSVETGSVLADICAATQTHKADGSKGLARYSQKMQTWLANLVDSPPSRLVTQAPNVLPSMIQDNVVTLLKSHRFNEYSGIGQLAKQINKGRLDASYSLLKNTHLSDIQWCSPSQINSQNVETEILQNLIVKLLPIYQDYFKAVRQGELEKAFDYLSKQQILCAQKGGYWGVNQLNALIEQELAKQGVIDNTQDFYLGRPIMLAKNAHPLKLFNGDIGIVMPDPANPRLTKVWFAISDGSSNMSYKGLLASRLPEFDTIYAMTIHKSQGSEFDSVYLCLPLVDVNNQGKGLSRELLYTGLTRAKTHFSLFAQAKALKLSLVQQCIRGSGLAERLQR